MKRAVGVGTLPAVSITVPSRLACLLLTLLLPRVGEAQAAGIFFGTVVDAETGKPVRNVRVDAWSASLPAPVTSLTDDQGRYRTPRLPADTYNLTFWTEDYSAHSLGNLVLRKGHSLRVDVRLVWEAPGEVDFLMGPPFIDVGSTSTGAKVDPQLPTRLATHPPSEGDGAARPAERLARWVPGVTEDLSIAGASPYENDYRLDGLSTRDAVSGLNALPVSTEFTPRLEVLTGGATPDHSRATGGLFLLETPWKGSELQATVFTHHAPGLLEGRRTPLRYQGDVGATLGGELLRNKLWFYAGIVPSLGRAEHSAGDHLQALGRLTAHYATGQLLTLSVLTARDSLQTEGAGLNPGERDSAATRVMLHHTSTSLPGSVYLDVRAGWLGQRRSGPRTAGGALEDLLATAQPMGAVDTFQGNVQAMWNAPPAALGNFFLKVAVDAEHSTFTPEGEAIPWRSGVLGGSVQAQWVVSQRVTVNGGLRYDVQRLSGEDTRVSSQRLSPHVGLIVAPWQHGRTKLFAFHRSASGLVPLGLLTGATPEPNPVEVDPALELPVSRELGVGLESEVLPEVRLAASFTHRTLGAGVGFLSNEDGAGGVLVNPGSGLASGLPEAERTYDAVKLALTRDFKWGWMGHVSYTGSRLHGNHAGPGAPAAGASGPLPWDRPHVLRAYGARDVLVARYLFLTPGLSYLGASGTPVAGLEARTPWVHSVDAHLGARWQLQRGRKDSVSLNLDAFNVFNFQAATRLEPRDAGLVATRHQPPRQVRLGLRYTNF